MKISCPVCGTVREIETDSNDLDSLVGRVIFCNNCETFFSLEIVCLSRERSNSRD